ncbi:lysylphosphatidylglycerol synthase transmembrane domain-containing protein [Pararhodobacter sp.]|uniref:lysylphosphatidylglycerol synthase transmembrane domain-containing protein n=1 Tax=Pararhodobacter sp. TaxID=2127056 RepID=UPI002AFE38E0|nr:lysylphosphatidylglycerol synthase transmembrane domain-containing protein [Pararhodobacter sp.]
MRRTASLGLGIALGGLFLWLTLRQVDFAALADAIRRMDLVALLLAPLCLAVGYACRIQRWHLMLRPHNAALGYAHSSAAFLASIAVNNLAPFRMGDALRCFGFSNWLGVAPGAVLATVLIERVLDMIALLLALALALWLFSTSGDALGIGGTGALVLAGGSVLALFLLVQPRLLAPLVAALIRGLGRLGPKVRSRADGFLTPLVHALVTMSARRAMTALIVWTVPVWLFEGATYWAVARAMPSLTAPEAAWLAMPVGTLSTLLPSTPGHVGTFDYFAQTATVIAGNPLAEATAFVLIVHLVLWLTTTLTGGVCLLIWALAPSAKARP